MAFASRLNRIWRSRVLSARTEGRSAGISLVQLVGGDHLGAVRMRSRGGAHAGDMHAEA